MPAYFLDSSALVKRYVEEPGSDRIDALIDSQGDDGVVVSRLATVEVTAALVRRTRRGDLSDQDLDAALAYLEADTERRFRVIELGGASLMRAVDLVRKHGLRAADGIQLACALIARGEHASQRDLTLVSSDAELNAAAERENLIVIDAARE